MRDRTNPTIQDSSMAIALARWSPMFLGPHKQAVLYIVMLTRMSPGALIDREVE